MHGYMQKYMKVLLYFNLTLFNIEKKLIKYSKSQIYVIGVLLMANLGLSIQTSMIIEKQIKIELIRNLLQCNHPFLSLYGTYLTLQIKVYLE